MMPFTRLFNVLTFMAIVGCGQRNSSEEIMLLEIPEESQLRYDFSQLIEGNFEITPLELSYSSGLVMPDKGLIKDGLLFLGDRGTSRSILVFDLQNKKEIASPFLLGEGPDAFAEITDYLIYGNQLMILDGIKRRIAIYTISLDSITFQKFLPIDFGPQRFSFDGENGYFLNGGGTEQLFTITDKDFKTIKAMGTKNAAHLLKPYNSFHEVIINGSETILFHATFDNIIYEASKGNISQWKKIQFPNRNLDIDLEEFPIQSDFNDFQSKMKPFNSYFIIFEKSDEKSHFLVYSGNDTPKVSIKSTDLNINLPLLNINNDITFEAHMPAVIGTHQGNYVAITSVEGVNRNSSEFKESKMGQLLNSYPDAEYFLLVFKFK
ncbi:6-bladed beta-propeller [Aquiflexum lacus]|uniref:6-bladed beta-propeller n=1 Tax=Aquiflexum lacus TaxID=2483805 RepID=UPI001893B261|nr:6-bladed beta-propeller [Aquiflexum lacus]